ncbi:MAG: glucoamylase family protein [Cyclobacteriaceae bacterium]
MRVFLFLSVFVLFSGCGDDDTPTDPVPDIFQLSALRVGTIDILENEVITAPVDKPVICSFSKPLDREEVEEAVQLVDDSNIPVSLTISYLDDDKSISLQPDEDLKENVRYAIEIANTLRSEDGSVFPGISKSFTTINTPVGVLSAQIDGKQVDAGRIANISFTPEVKITFTDQLSVEDVENAVSIVRPGVKKNPTITQESPNTLIFNFNEALEGYQKFRFRIAANATDSNKPFDEYDFEFYTQLDSTLKFEELSDEALLTKVQEQTFKYFYDFGHPNSGLARERDSSGDIVTIGGSGFGIMSLIVGIERGFITRQQGVDRIETIVNFLANDADRFHGAWSHWLNGNTGAVIPFGATDDGADLVETAFLVQGLLTVRQYLDKDNMQEANIINTINVIWQEVEWDWFQQDGDSWLTWHWSPNFGFDIDLPVRGWDEALMVYVLAASSSEHSIPTNLYTEGWARSGGMANGNQYYGVTLPLGVEKGGPLFFSHYSFLGLDPRNLSDTYANYWEQNVAHSKINHAHCVDNPFNYVGYQTYSWGLTASDNQDGYLAHSPTQDIGVITPTAAISSIPYTPEESLSAIRHFYYILGDKLWGTYGFYDAFNVTEGWYANSYLAIDQGPIVCMIENYRTGLLWDLFMSAPEVQSGLDKLGFTY